MTVAGTPNPPLADAFRLSDPDLAIYSALKLEVYRRMTARPAGASQPWITAARLTQIFAQLGPGSRAEPSPDLFRASPYFFRERLRGLNHGTFLRGDGGRRRRNFAYAWNERVTSAQRQHFAQLQTLLGADVHLARDVQAIHEMFGDRPFARRVALRGFHDRHRRIVGKTAGHKFHAFMLRRLESLARRGVLEAHGEDLRLSEVGHQVLHWLDLFVYRAEPETA